MQALLSRTSKSLHDLRRNAWGNKPISVPCFWITEEKNRKTKYFLLKRKQTLKMSSCFILIFLGFYFSKSSLEGIHFEVWMEDTTHIFIFWYSQRAPAQNTLKPFLTTNGNGNRAIRIRQVFSIRNKQNDSFVFKTKWLFILLPHCLGQEQAKDGLRILQTQINCTGLGVLYNKAF